MSYFAFSQLVLQSDYWSLQLNHISWFPSICTNIQAVYSNNTVAACCSNATAMTYVNVMDADQTMSVAEYITRWGRGHIRSNSQPVIMIDQCSGCVKHFRPSATDFARLLWNISPDVFIYSVRLNRFHVLSCLCQVLCLCQLFLWLA